MNKFRVPGCFRSCLSFGCLSLILLIIVGVILVWKKPLDTKLFKIDEPVGSSVGSYVSNDNDNPVATQIVLLSDSEDENEQVSKVLGYATESGIENVFHVGDLTHLGVPAKLKELKELFDSSGLNIYAVPGDRDLWKSKGISAYNEYFGNSYRYETIDGVNFLFIDNANEYEGIDDKQWSFIEEHINTTDFVLIHNPLIPTGVALIGDKVMGEYDIAVSEQRVKLLNLIRDSSVKALFSGDQHYYSEVTDAQKPDLKQYVLSTVNADRSIQTPSFAILTVYEDHSYIIEKILIGN